MSFPANNQQKQPSVVQELRTKLHVMLDKRRASKDNVINFAQAGDRSVDAIFLEEYQALVGAVTDYFFISDEEVEYEDYYELKEIIGSLQKSVKKKGRKSRKSSSKRTRDAIGKQKRRGSRGRPTVDDHARDFLDISSRTRVAGIQKLSQNQLEQAYMAAQQLEAEIEAESQTATSDIQNMDPDEIKAEKELALQAQLPFKKEKKLLMTLKTDLENALRARQSSTPTLNR